MEERNYKKVEGILYEVPRLRAEIANLQIDLEEILDITTATFNRRKNGSLKDKLISLLFPNDR